MVCEGFLVPWLTASNLLPGHPAGRRSRSAGVWNQKDCELNLGRWVLLVITEPESFLQNCGWTWNWLGTRWKLQPLRMIRI